MMPFLICSDNAPYCETVHAPTERLSPVGICQREKRRGPGTTGKIGRFMTNDIIFS